MKKTLTFVLTSALITMLAVSCTKNSQLTDPGDGSNGGEAVSLEKEFGGYSTDDEAVAFGDSDLLNDSTEDQDVTDTFSTDAEVINALSYDGVDTNAIKVYFLRATWGLLEGDSTATEIVDWSGSAKINKGTLVVLKTIRFEHNDAIILPRTSRQSVEFTSQTKPHFDGIALAIINNDSTDLVGTFTLTAGSYSKTLNFSELDSLELLESVGDSGHKVSILSRSKEYIPFAGGFFAGRWIKVNQHGGRFKGRWINSMGTNAGHLHGIWGINRAGKNVFKGKHINFNGQFRGLLAGEWNYDRDNHSGSFRGRWVNSNHHTIGVLRGKFKTGKENDRRGFFHGRYRVHNTNNTEGN